MAEHYFQPNPKDPYGNLICTDCKHEKPNSSVDRLPAEQRHTERGIRLNVLREQEKVSK